MQKTGKTPYLILIIRETPHFGILVAFWSENLKRRLFSKKPIRSTVRLYVAVASCKKSEKVHVSEKTNISYTLIGIHKENIAYVLNE